MGIWESIQNPLRAEGILSSRVRWPGKKTIQLAPCFSAPAWTTRKNQGCFAELSGNGWKPQSFVFSNFDSWLARCSPERHSFSPSLHESIKAKNSQSSPTNHPGFTGGVASSAVPLWLKVTRTSPRCCVFGVSTCNGDSLGEMNENHGVKDYILQYLQ